MHRGISSKSEMAAKKKPEAGAVAAARVDLAEVEKLLAFMDEHGLEEFEYAAGDLHIRLKKAGARTSSMALRAPEIVVAGAPGVGVPGAETPRELVGDTSRGEDLHIIKSPIVGTFYEGPSPGAPPFVKVGDQVTVGQVLCIIEAMKLMNEIESDAAGEVARVYGENGQPVEYGESLFAIRPARKK